jgi:serine protease Do
MRLPFGAVLVAVLLGAGAAVAPAGAGWAKPAVNPAEKAAATVAPAVLYLEVNWHGQVRDRTTGTLYDPAGVDLTTRCSGFAVSSDGYLVTAGHCVDPGPEGITPAFLAAIADRFQQTNRLAPTDRAAFLSTLATNAEVEGDGPGEPPRRTVTVQRGDVTPGRTGGADVFSAQVIDVHSRSAGDVALLKADRTNQPVAALAGVPAPPTGTDVIALGYPVDGQTGPTLSATVQGGQLSGPSTADGLPFYEVAAPTREGMDGGPVVSLNGEVLGLLSHAPGGTSGPPTALSPVSLITDELGKNKVHNDLGKIDKDYRDGLNAYYDGRYTEAIAKFDSVLAMAPSHIQAQQYQQKAVSLRETEGEPLDPQLVLYGTIGAGVLLLILILLITVLIVRGRRRRRARRLAAAAGPVAPTPTAPAALTSPTGVAATTIASPARATPPPVPPGRGLLPPTTSPAVTPAPVRATGPAAATPPVARPPAPPLPAPPVFSAPAASPPAFSAPIETTAAPLSPVPVQPIVAPASTAPAFSESAAPAVPVSEPPVEPPSAPVFAEPVFAEPVVAEPALDISVISEPLNTGPASTEPVNAGLALPEPATTRPAIAELAPTTVEPVWVPPVFTEPEPPALPALTPEPEPEPLVPSKWDLDLPPLAPGTPIAAGPTGAPPAVTPDLPPPPPVRGRPLPPPSLLYCSNCSNASPAGTAVCPTCGQPFS